MPDEKKTPEPAHVPLPPAVAEEEMDAATASLSTALRFSFFLLKVVMLVLLVVFAASGFYHVDRDEVALELRFGRITGVGEDRIKRSGEWRFAWPAPVGEVVRVSTAPRDLSVNTFWPRISELAREDALETRGRIERVFDDAENAYILTGDMVETMDLPEAVDTEALQEVEETLEGVPAPNLVQARFSVQYAVRPGNAERYFLNVMDEGKDRHGEDLIRSIVQASVVQTVAGLGVYDILLDRVSVGGMVRERVQRALDEIDSGITVTSVSMQDKAPPSGVASAFDDVSAADQRFRSQISAAEGYRNDILSRAAGAQGQRIHESLQELWRAETLRLLRRAEEEDAEAIVEERPWMEEEIREAEKRIADLRLRVDALFRHSESNELLVEGEAARIIRDAESDRERIVSRARGAAEVATALLDKYDAEEGGEAMLLNYLTHRRLETLANFVDRAEEKFYLSGKPGENRELRLRLSRNPEALQRRSRIESSR